MNTFAHKHTVRTTISAINVWHYISVHIYRYIYQSKNNNKYLTLFVKRDFLVTTWTLLFFHQPLINAVSVVYVRTVQFFYFVSKYEIVLTYNALLLTTERA